MKQKKCYGCKKYLSVDNFTKNKKTKDGLSYYCRDCSKRNYSLHRYRYNNKKNYETIIIKELKKYDIPIDQFDIEKIKNTRISLYDFPGAIRPFLKDLVRFCQKYNLSYEEYKFFIDACCNNNFFINGIESISKTDDK